MLRELWRALLHCTVVVYFNYVTFTSPITFWHFMSASRLGNQSNPLIFSFTGVAYNSNTTTKPHLEAHQQGLDEHMRLGQAPSSWRKTPAQKPPL